MTMATKTMMMVLPWYPWYMTRRLLYQMLNAQMVKVMPLLQMVTPLVSPCLISSLTDSSSIVENYAMVVRLATNE